MNKLIENFFGHLRTIRQHRRMVMIHCFKAGIPIMGLLHDLSKYSPTEFIPGVLYYQGNRSPYYMQIERAIRNGARIDCIGMQFHMFYRAEKEAEETAQFYDPERIFDVLDTYAKLGRNIQITELTIPAYAYTEEDEVIQAEIIKNLYSMWFSHPAMEAILYWNLVDGFAHGAKQGDMTAGENYYRGGLLRYDFTPKASYRMIQELFQKVWRTNLSLDTETETLTFKGFYGTYELEITAGGKTEKREIHLDRHSNNKFDIII